MKKPIKELTLAEITAICNQHFPNCENCPLQYHIPCYYIQIYYDSYGWDRLDWEIEL